MNNSNVFKTSFEEGNNLQIFYSNPSEIDISKVLKVLIKEKKKCFLLSITDFANRRFRSLYMDKTNIIPGLGDLQRLNAVQRISASNVKADVIKLMENTQPPRDNHNKYLYPFCQFYCYCYSKQL